MKRLYAIILLIIWIGLAACEEASGPNLYTERVDAQATQAAAQAYLDATEQAINQQRARATVQAAQTAGAAQVEIQLLQAKIQATQDAQELALARGRATDQADKVRATESQAQAWQAGTATAAARGTATAIPQTATAIARIQQREANQAVWNTYIDPLRTLIPTLVIIGIVSLLIMGAVLWLLSWDDRSRVIHKGPHDSPMYVARYGRRLILVDLDKAFGPALLLGAGGAISAGHAPMDQDQLNLDMRAMLVDLVNALPRNYDAGGAAQHITGQALEELAINSNGNLPASAPWLLVQEWRQPNSFPLGLSEDGPIVLDPERTPHLMVVGSTGTGKTRSALLPLATCGLANSWQVMLLNDAGGDFAPILMHPNLEHPGDQANVVAGALEWAAQEVDRRAALLRELGVSTWSRLLEDERQGANLMVVVDELVALAWSNRGEVGERIWNATVRITSKGRKVGIMLATASTDPTYRTLGRQGLTVRDNCGLWVFRVRSEGVSRAALDQTGAEQLARGHFILRPLAGEIVQGVAFHPSDGEVSMLASRPVAPLAPLSLPEPSIDASDEREAQVRTLLCQGVSINEACRQVFGFTGGSAYDFVKRISDSLECGND